MLYIIVLSYQQSSGPDISVQQQMEDSSEVTFGTLDKCDGQWVVVIYFESNDSVFRQM